MYRPSVRGPVRRAKSFPGGKSSVRTPSRRKRLIVTIGMMEAPVPTASATLSFTIGTETPSGVLVSASGRGWTFHGWIELGNAIEQWRAEQRLADSRPPTE